MNWKNSSTHRIFNLHFEKYFLYDAQNNILDNNFSIKDQIKQYFYHFRKIILIATMFTKFFILNFNRTFRIDFYLFETNNFSNSFFIKREIIFYLITCELNIVKVILKLSKNFVFTNRIPVLKYDICKIEH